MVTVDPSHLADQDYMKEWTRSEVSVTDLLNLCHGCYASYLPLFSTFLSQR